MQGLRRLKECPVPPMLEDALGYRGERRYVAFYWTPAGDELMYDYGILGGDGDWAGWLKFIYHPRVEPHLKLLDLGSSETDAVDWLVLDRKRRELLAGSARTVRQFLALQVKDAVLPQIRSVEDLRELLRTMAASPPSTMPVQELVQARTQMLSLFSRVDQI